MPNALTVAENQVLPQEIKDRINGIEKVMVTEVVRAFLEMSGTATARATHYNTKEEQLKAADQIHGALFDLDRGVYGAFLALPGTMDFAKQLGITRLLDNSRVPGTISALTAEGEAKLLKYLLRGLPVPRMLKLFGMLRGKRLNANRTRKLILRTILGSPKIELWTVKYRQKIRAALEHAWGIKKSAVIRTILAKGIHNAKDVAILKDSIDRYCGTEIKVAARECVAFALGLEEEILAVGPSLELLKAYIAAKTDFDAGKVLPFETLDGIRSKFHKNRTSAEALALTKENLTNAQKMNLQAKAEKDKVEVEMDPLKYDAVKLYTYAFERGFSKKINDALAKKAKSAARSFPLSFGKVGIVVDASQSMRGHDTQPLRPFAVALAVRDLIGAASESVETKYVGGQKVTGDRYEKAQVPVRPGQGTNLAKSVLELFKAEVEAVFIITDGYENAPAGRTAEVIAHARKIGIETPVYQLTPVFAAEAAGVRDLYREEVPTLPVSNPAALGVTLLRGLIDTEPLQGIEGLLRMTLPKFIGTVTQGGE